MELELKDEQTIFAAMSGAQYVVHCASPSPLSRGLLNDTSDMIDTTVTGTIALLRAAKQNQVKRVVISSSITTVLHTNDSQKNHFTDKDWSDLSLCNAYDASKILME